MALPAPPRPRAGTLTGLVAQATGLGWWADAAITIVIALAIWVVAARLALRLARPRRAAERLYELCRWPARLTVTSLALRVALDGAPLDPTAARTAEHAATIVVIFSAAWLLLRGLVVVEEALLGRFDISTEDNLRARTARTQVLVLRRVTTVVVVGVASLVALQTFDVAQRLWTALLASAGVIGVVVGITGRSTIGNLVAGLQIAFAEPVRIDDVVVVEGEWGHVEEITLTYIVVRLWDQRRLVLPSSYFVENPFQNWTRRSAEVIGTVELWVDYGVPVDALRAEVDAFLGRSHLWDGRVAVLQVTDASERAVKVRALVSARNAPMAWDLRCEVREHLVGWLQRHHPDALPRLRLEHADERALSESVR